MRHYAIGTPRGCSTCTPTSVVMGKPRLLHIIPSINRGGIETLVLGLIKLQSRHYDVTVWYTGEVPGCPTLEEALKGSGARAVHRIDPPSRRRLIKPHPPDSFRGIEQFDIVHNHIYPYFYLIGAIKRYCGARLVSTLHRLYEKPHPATHPRLFWNEYRFGKRIDRLTVVSEAVKNTVTFPQRVEVIHNGVDLEAFPFTQRDPGPSGPFTFVCVANLVPLGKGYEVLLPAFDTVCAKHPHARLVCVGYFDPTYRDALTRGRDFDHSVLFTGSIADTAPFLYSSHCFALFSQREGLPISLLEAAASGLPIIGSSVGGIPEIIRDETLGYLLQGHECASASALMETVMLDYPAAVEKVERCRALIEADYTLEKTHRAYEALYRNTDEPISAGGRASCPPVCTKGPVS